MPGAFTPTCDARHLPGFIDKAAALQGKGVAKIVCMGRHLVQGALNRDYTLVMGMVIVYAALMIAFNLLADLAYAALDPRIRRERRL